MIDSTNIAFATGIIFFSIIFVSVVAIVLEYYLPTEKKANFVTAQDFKNNKEQKESK